eukprot:CAMPEP_0203637790 /NCGR_PEP_ID=MMETSP0088-20131115/4021_1 /ASSEMBLY_ACC=CAM_ASM_001087 /TAXON_ID=426623 /ORGANISM="Chaetoceros affinis, Strain CCMP159" /LENGTH=122 /DNA_ID=CAMNT_0050492309 /DNA_START=147 /DNA_END=516 /DNA_ORIENTATION=-
MDPPAYLLQTPVMSVHTVFCPRAVFGHVGNYLRTSESYDLGEESVATPSSIFEEWVELFFDSGVVIIPLCIDAYVDAIQICAANVDKTKDAALCLNNSTDNDAISITNTASKGRSAAPLLPF